MEDRTLEEPALIGREAEMNKLRQALESAMAGKGSTIFIGGEAGIGKTRLVSEAIKIAEENGFQVLRGWCLPESMEPLMPVKTALRDAGLSHLISGDPPPMVISVYLMNSAGMLIAKVEREESDLDPDIFAGMLQAVGNFVHDSFSMMKRGGDAGLNSIGYGEYTILIRSAGEISLALVIKGSRSEFLIEDMDKTLADIGDKYDAWTGDTSAASAVQSKISWFVDSGKYDGKFLVDDPKVKQENLFDNILLWVQRASAVRPLLLFLDDMQWADPTTLKLIHYLSRNTRNYRVIMLGTYRPEDIVQEYDGKAHHLETTMQEMNREGLLEKIELKRLGLEDTKRIIRSVLKNTDFSNKFFYRIYRETDGTPLFVLELLRLLVEDGSIAKNEKGEWSLVQDIDVLDIPSKVYDVVKRRLDRLTEEERDILECASVIGEEFQSDIVGKVTGISRIHLLKKLREIEKKHRLIHSLDRNYVFDHTKIREVLYRGIPDELRQEYHRIVADTMAELWRDKQDELVNELAHHYYRAKDARAVEFLVLAGDKAAEKYANTEAATFYEQALEFIEGNDAIEVLEKLADVQVYMGKYEKAIENFLKASELAEDNETKARMLMKASEAYEKKGDYDQSIKMIEAAMAMVKKGTAEYGRIALAAGYPHWRKGDNDRAMPLFLEALKMAEDNNADPKDIGNALRAVGNIYSNKGEYEHALEYYEKSLKVLENTGYQWGIAAAMVNIGTVLHSKGEMKKALEYHRRSLEIFEKIGNKQGIAMALNNLGNGYQVIGNLDKALEYHQRSLEIFEKIGNKQGIAMSLTNIGTVLHSKGEMKKALEYHQRSLEIFEKIGYKHGIATVLNSIGAVYQVIGNLDKALEYHQRSLEIFEEMGNKYGITMCLNSIGTVYQDMGNLDKALEYHQRSLEIYKKIGNKWGMIYGLFGMAEAYLGLGKTKMALESAKQAMDISMEIGSEEGMSRLALGMVYRAMGELDKAEEELLKSISESEEIKDSFNSSRAHYEYGLLLKKKGDIEGAREHIEKAISEREKAGIMLHLDRYRKALEELG